MLSPRAPDIARAVEDPRLSGMLVRGAPDPLLAGAGCGFPEPLFLRGDSGGADLAALDVQIGTQAGPVTTILAPLVNVSAPLDVAGTEAIDALTAPSA